MYAGRIVEHAPVDELFARPLHPVHAGAAALDAGARHAPRAPRGDSRAGARASRELPSGCAFRDRCPLADRRVRRGRAAARGAAPPGHLGGLHPRMTARAARRGRAACASTSRSGAAASAGRAPSCARSTDVSLDDRARARRSGWSASRAAASRRSARLILRLLEPTAGDVRFDGRSLLALRPRELRAMRRAMQIVFQDPYGSLNPRMRVGEHRRRGAARSTASATRRAARERGSRELLELVGLPRRRAPRATRTSSAAASASASASRARSRSSRASSSPTSRSRRSTSRSRRRS